MEEAALIDALRRLAAYDAAPAKERSRASRLASRIQTSVRVTLLGPQDAHIKGLIQQLLGESLPPLPPAPVTFGHGETEKVLAIRPCGTVEDVSNHHGPTAALLFESPASFLSRVQLTVFPWQITCENPPNYSEIDIAIWCSDSFAADEFALWNDAPNILKDHSFLLATTAETPELAEIEFLSFYQTTSREYASKTYASVARDLNARVESGRAADLDNAALFVEMHRELLCAAPPAPLRPEPAVIIRPKPKFNEIETALSLVRQDASYMLSALDGDRADAFETVLAYSAKTGQSLADLVEQDSWASADLALKEEVLNCADRLVLLSMEAGAEPTFEAVSTLLQLKRDFETCLAA